MLEYSTRRIAISLYRESAGGVADYGDGGEIIDSHLAESAPLADFRDSADAEVIDDSDTRAALSGMPNQNSLENGLWQSGISFSGPADADLLGMLFLITCGKVSTAQVDTATYDHTFSPMDLDADGIQPPSTALGVFDGDSWLKYGGIVGRRLTLRGGMHERITVEGSVAGSGRVTPMAGYTPPSIRNARKFRDALNTITINAIDETVRIVSWMLEWQNQPVPDREMSTTGAVPWDEGSPEKGFVRAENEIARQSAQLSLSLEMTGRGEWERMRDVTASDLEINCGGIEQIEPGYFDGLTISAGALSFRAARQVRHENRIVWEIVSTPMVPTGGGLSDSINLKLRSGRAAYGLLQ